MWRLLILLIVIATAGCMLAWLLTGRVQYRRWAWLLGRFGLGATLIFFGLLVLERLAV